jgi:hypothetical protein
MLTDLCDLLESRMESLSLRQKAEIFIGTIHIQKDPVFSLMHKLVKDIEYKEFGYIILDFLKHSDATLEKELTLISMTDKGWLTFYDKKCIRIKSLP